MQPPAGKKSSCVSAGVLLTLILSCATTQAQVRWSDNLEAGAGNWTLTAGAAGTAVNLHTTTNRVPGGGNNSLWFTNSGPRAYVNNLPTGFGITGNGTDSCRFSYWLYDPATPSANLSVRAFAEIMVYSGGGYGNGSIQHQMAIGPYNSWGGSQPIVASKYSGRVVYGYPGEWFTLNGGPDRSAGWHHFSLERGVNGNGDVILKFFVDGMLGRVFTNTATYKLANWNTLRAGLGAGTSAGNYWHDGYEVAQGQAFITEEPKNTTNLLNSPVTLSVSAYGSADTVYYQWYKNGADISGATDSTYLIGSCQFSDSGWYSVMASNSLGAVTSSAPARLQVAGITILTQPTNLVVNLGSNNVSFYCEAQGGGTLSYLWKKDGADLPGATDSLYTIPVVGVNELASNPGYVCVVTNELGDTATSNPATLRSNAPPAIAVINNITTSPGTALMIPVTGSDDYSSSGVFQTFESGTVGTGTMFQYPAYSGSATPYVTPVGAYTYVTNSGSVPAGNPRTGTKSLFVTMNFTNQTTIGWDRLTTVSYNPIVWFLGPLKFDIWTDRPMGVSVGLRETSPSGAIGANGGTSGDIENAGVSQPGSIPHYIYSTTAGVWTNFTYDLADSIWPNWAFDNIYGAGLSGGDGFLDSTTGKGVIENVGLVPADGLGVYRIYLDNFQSVGPNPLLYSLEAAPSGATIDPYSGLIEWTAETGNHTFTVRLTDSFGLYNERTFSVNVALPAIAITPNGDSVELNWTGSYQLQSNSVSIGDANQWYDVTGVTTGPFNATVSPGATTFFRLRN